MTAGIALRDRAVAAATIGRLATQALILEVETWPKPGLVSHIDNGAHDDMDAALLRRSARRLEPFFAELAAAGAAGAAMAELRRIGIAAEQAMRAATGGVNSHRGAIFGLGLLVAAAGYAGPVPAVPLGRIIAEQWGTAILASTPEADSHGTLVARRYQASGARGQAAAGLPAVYQIARPALAAGRRLAPGDEEAARVHACMALIARVEDSNLLYRGGLEGLAFAQQAAGDFLAAGGVGQRHWRRAARHIHQQFVARRLSPGGCADLLGMALFSEAVEP